MKAASVCTVLGLTLISGALLAATTGMADDTAIRVKAQFDSIDTDENRQITPTEAEVSPGLSEHFDKLDRDADGTISWREFRRHGMPEDAAA